MPEKICLVIDGNNLMHREFHGVPPLKTKTGIYTHAVLGFTNKILKYLDELEPEYVVIAYDRPEPTFRHLEYDGYKASRTSMADELRMQFPYSQKIAEAMGVNIITKAGYEADDVIGTVANIASQNGIKTVILSGDRDVFQLITDDVTVKFLNNKNEDIVYTTANIMDEYGIAPYKFIDLKALMGDKSDEIPGVRGIGEKTALKLITENGSLDELYKKIDEGTFTATPKLYASLTDGRDAAYMSRRLAAIETNAPLDLTMADIKRKPLNKPTMSDLCTELELKSIAKKLNLSERTADALPDGFFENLKFENAGNINGIEKYFDGSETIFIGIFEEELAGLYTLYIADKSKYYTFDYSSSIDFTILLNGKYKIGGTSIKDLYSFFKKLNCDPKPETFTFDLTLAAYMLSPTDSDYGANKLAFTYLSCMYDESGERDLAVMPYLREVMLEKIEEYGQNDLYYTIELPLAILLAEMELQGFRIDEKGIEDFGRRLGVECDSLQNEIYSMCGETFNINSPKQLGEILFDKLNLPFGVKKKTGYSTNADILEKLRNIHPAVSKILDYRSHTKLKATYCDGLLKLLSDDGKLHTNFNQTITATGRLSSTEPNLHNIPVRTELGREMRKFFIPQSKDHVLIDADYSQIELRVLAHISGDQTLVNAFKNNVDIHKLTASSAFRVPLDEVTKEMRSSAKAVNFGIVYGISDYSLSEDLKIPVQVAREYIEGYFAKYPSVKSYMDEIVKFAEETGYVTTIMNRRRYIPELISSNKNIKSFGERVARNTPIQGSAADIMKAAMIKCGNALKASKLESRIILQIHDELIIESPRHEIKEATEIIRDAMENAVLLAVPVTVDISYGDSWYDAKE